MSTLIPDLRESFTACKRRSERVTRRVGGVKALSQALDTYRPHETSFFERYDLWSAARHAASVALGLQRDAETALDNQLRMVAYVLRGLDGGARRSVLVRNVYPGGYGQALMRKGSEALQIAQGVLQGIDENAHPEVVARREPLSAAIAALQDAKSACEAAFGALAEAKATLVAERTRWRHAFIAFYFDSVQVYPEKRSYINRLFRVKSSRDAAEEEPETEPETGGAGDGAESGAELGENGAATESEVSAEATGGTAVGGPNDGSQEAGGDTGIPPVDDTLGDNID